MKELGITKGEWKVNKTSENLHDVYCPEFSNWLIVENIKPNDAKLIADAGITANKCQMLPSELLERYNEAIEVLEKATRELISIRDDEFLYINDPLWSSIDVVVSSCEQTISKAHGN